jgi:hypothetical protein
MRAIPAVAALFAVSALNAYAGSAACRVPATIEHAHADAGPVAKNDEDRQLRNFFDRIDQLAAHHDAEQVRKCCASAGTPRATAPVCSFGAYVASGSKAESLLSAAPKGKDQVEWLWHWDAVVQRTGGSRFADGFAAAYVDALLDTTDKAPGEALDRLFEIYRYADGEYAEYIGDRLVKLFEARPDAVLAGWSSVKRNRQLVERALDLYPERRNAVASVYQRHCSAGRGPPCGEALDVFAPSKS